MSKRMKDGYLVDRRLSHGTGEDKMVGAGVSATPLDADMEQRLQHPIQPDEIVHAPDRWRP